MNLDLIHLPSTMNFRQVCLNCGTSFLLNYWNILICPHCRESDTNLTDDLIFANDEFYHMVRHPEEYIEYMIGVSNENTPTINNPNNDTIISTPVRFPSQPHQILEMDSVDRNIIKSILFTARYLFLNNIKFLGWTSDYIFNRDIPTMNKPLFRVPASSWGYRSQLGVDETMQIDNRQWVPISLEILNLITRYVNEYALGNATTSPICRSCQIPLNVFRIMSYNNRHTLPFSTYSNLTIPLLDIIHTPSPYPHHLHLLVDHLTCPDCYIPQPHRLSPSPENDDNTPITDMGSDEFSEHDYTDEQEETDYLNPYDYRPTPYFFSCAPTRNTVIKRKGEISRERPIETYFGLEIEVEQASSTTVRYDALRRITQISQNNTDSPIENLLYLKRDSSLNYGFEIVTMPMTLDFIQNHGDALWETLKFLKSIQFKSWDTTTCGLHIHINRNSFRNTLHAAKFMYFIYKNPTALIKFAGRESTNFADFSFRDFMGWPTSDFSIPTLMEIHNGQKDNGDYIGSSPRNLALNRNPYETYELRFFRPSLRAETIKAAVELTHAIKIYCLNSINSYTRLNDFDYHIMNDPNVDDDRTDIAASNPLSWQSFLDKMTSERYKKQYPNMILKLKERNLL